MLATSHAVLRAQSQRQNPADSLPSAPQPKLVVKDKSKVGPCRVIPSQTQAGSVVVSVAAQQVIANAGLELVAHGHEASSLSQAADLPPCPPAPLIDWFARFLNGPEVKPLTPKEKARLALRNLLDPFNAVTILGTSGIAVAADPDSPYGPGFPGFGRSVGVAYTQDLSSEFFGTFLIPSLAHQDPHYHRMPSASIPRRIGHAIAQVIWTQGDNGRGMPNYSNILGYAIVDELSNLYVPGRQTNLPASASRYAIGLATAPTDNFITEFLPDVARRIHIRIVLVQRIIDQVSRTDGGTLP
ncbi:MAG TPA: hypothetical protein VF392_10585 [Terracidiphilus sp.]